MVKIIRSLKNNSHNRKKYEKYLTMEISGAKNKS
jgi:hypothetical protein